MTTTTIAQLKEAIARVAKAYDSTDEFVELAFATEGDGIWGWTVRVAPLKTRHGAGYRVLRSATSAWDETLVGAVERACSRARFSLDEERQNRARGKRAR